MDSTLTPLVHRVSLEGLELSIREWPGESRPFLLVHGLASNARTWDGVGRRLSAEGHRAVAVDQRGHGLSDKPHTGYGFDAVTADLRELIAALGLRQPVIAGQSWGGNVVLDFAARYADVPAGVVLVDGGFIELSARPGATWESISQQMRPPDLIGTPRSLLIERFQSFHPGWDIDQIEMQMGNYETLPDGTIRPWLTLDRHMEILRAMWEQRPSELCGRVKAPTLIAVADAPTEERRKQRMLEVSAIAARLERARVRHFEGAPHDIHVDRPEELAGWMLDALRDGFFDL